MKKPSKQTIDQMKENIVADLSVVAARIQKTGELRLELNGDPALTLQEAKAMASIETFVAIALRVMAGTNASKIRDAMIAVEIQARMDGKHVYE